MRVAVLDKILHRLKYGKPRKYKTWVPLGHFFSPFPDLEKIKAREGKIWDLKKEIKGIDLNVEEQLELFHMLTGFYKDLPFGDTRKPGLRYYFQNESYLYSDAIFLYSMIRHLRPKRIIEVGSGLSSAATLDTNELFFNGAIDCTFIEPYPELFLSLLKETDEGKVKLIQSDLQEVGLEVFERLEPNDILFIDSTHTVKTDSDVNYIIFEILPALKKGVYIHFHDIFYPFEYPKVWVDEGRGWNEAYALRAFLQYNRDFKIVVFNHYLASLHRKLLEEKMPLCFKNTGGSLWLRKV